MSSPVGSVVLMVTSLYPSCPAGPCYPVSPLSPFGSTKLSIWLGLSPVIVASASAPFSTVPIV